MRFVKIRYEPEDEHHGELFVTAESDGFAGKSSAWFNRQEIVDFAAGLRSHPLERSELSRTVGSRTLVRICVQSKNPNGLVALGVELSSGDEPLNQAAIALTVDPASLDRFCARLIQSLESPGQEAVIQGLEK